ncbi:MAG: PKD domain-containing protein [Gemmatimonadota bacterium]
MRKHLPPLSLAGLLLLGVAGCEQITPPVIHFNQPPRADAGTDRQAAAGSLVVLDGGDSSDPEGWDLTYAWIQVSGPEAVGIQNGGSSQAAVTARTAGEYVFRLIVTDPGGASGTDEVRVVIMGSGPVVPTGGPPLADAGADGAARPGEAAVLDGAGSVDLDGGGLTYSWIQVSGPALVGILQADGARARVILPTEGVYVFRLTVTDDEGSSAVDEVRLIAAASPAGGPPSPANRAPAASAGPDLEVLVDAATVLDGGLSADADGDALSFGWIQVSGPVAVAILHADSETAAVTPTAAGVYVFRVIVTDAAGATSTDEVRLVVNALAVPAFGTIRIEGTFGTPSGGGS